MDLITKNTIKVTSIVIGMVAGALVLGYILFKLGPILQILGLSLFLVLALEQSIKFISSKRVFGRHISRSIAVLVTYLVLVLTMGLIITIGIPPLVTEGQRLITALVGLSKSIEFSYSLEQLNGLISKISTSAPGLSTNVFKTTATVFSNLATLLSILIISIYLSIDWLNIKNRIFEFFKDNSRKEAEKIFIEIENNIGLWVKGQLILMLSIGVITFIGLSIIDVRYILVLAIIAGLLEIVPVLGPMITAVLASIVVFPESTFKGVMVLVLFFVIQQLENSFLVPRIMGKVSGFSSLVVLIAILIGTSFLGIVGAILAIPVVMVLYIVGKRVAHLLQANGTKPQSI